MDLVGLEPTERCFGGWPHNLSGPPTPFYTAAQSGGGWIPSIVERTKENAMEHITREEFGRLLKELVEYKDLAVQWMEKQGSANALTLDLLQNLERGMERLEQDVAGLKQDVAGLKPMRQEVRELYEFIQASDLKAQHAEIG